MLQAPEHCIKPGSWMQLSELLKVRGNRKGREACDLQIPNIAGQGKGISPASLAAPTAVSFVGFFDVHGLIFGTQIEAGQSSLRGWEEAPIRICWPIAFTLMVGTLIFAGAFRSGAMIASVQVQPNYALSNGESKNLSAHYPPSQPFLYTLENTVPLVKLGMDEKWMPDPKHKPQPWFPQFNWLDWLGWFNSYWFLVTSRVLLIFLGWFQAGVLGAALLGRFKE